MRDIILTKEDLQFEDALLNDLRLSLKIRETILIDVNKHDVGFTIDTSKHLKSVSLLKTHNEVLKRFATSLLID